MNWNDIQQKLSGEWHGTNLLRLSWVNPPDSHSNSQMTIAQVAAGKFLSLIYTWQHENIDHEGFVLLGYHKEKQLVTASWVDSWHMNAKIMSFQGTLDDSGEINLLGFYDVNTGPDWGWRIVISGNSTNELQMTMFNISPKGEEDLAVRANYKRSK